jgi:hypothetical protein
MEYEIDGAMATTLNLSAGHWTIAPAERVLVTNHKGPRTNPSNDDVDCGDF